MPAGRDLGNIQVRKRVLRHVRAAGGCMIPDTTFIMAARHCSITRTSVLYELLYVDTRHYYALWWADACRKNIVVKPETITTTAVNLLL